MSSSFGSRLPFLGAVALVAAALGDPVVESISNTGILGPRGCDNNHLSIIPALLAGIVLFLEVAGMRCLELCRRSTSGERDWLVAVADRFAGRSPLQDLPCVLALQFVALYAMESIEARVVGGRAVVGLGWLGGPIVFSVLVHALIGAACIALFSLSMRALLATFASLVVHALAFVVAIARAGAAEFAHRDGERPRRRTQSPHLRQIGGRAPPALLAPA